MSDNSASRPKLWRETFDMLRRHAKEWMLYVIYFSVPMGLVQIFLDQQQLPTIEGQPPSFSGIFVVGQLINLVLVVISYYVFTVIFVQQQPLTNRPEFSVEGFFNWLGKVLAKFLIIIGSLIPLILVGAFLHKAVTHEVGQAIGLGLMAVLAVGFMWFLMVKYTLVGPLAVSGVAPTLKASWRLTHNNWWRLFWNQLAFGFFMVLIFLGFILGVILVSFAAGMHGQTQLGIFSKGVGLVAVVLVNGLVAMSIGFICTAADIFYREQQNISKGS